MKINSSIILVYNIKELGKERSLVTWQKEEDFQEECLAT